MQGGADKGQDAFCEPRAGQLVVSSAGAPEEHDVAQVPLHVEIWPSSSAQQAGALVFRAEYEPFLRGLGHGGWRGGAGEHAALHVQQLLFDGLLARMALIF